MILEFVILVGTLVVVAVWVEAHTLAVSAVFYPLPRKVNQLILVVVPVQLNSIAVSHWFSLAAVLLRSLLQ